MRSTASQATDSGQPNRLLNDVQLAAYLCISLGTVRRWRLHHEGPPFRKLNGGAVRYAPADVDAWLQRQPVGGAAA